MSDPSIPQLILFVVLVTAATGLTLTMIDSSERLRSGIEDAGDATAEGVRADVRILTSGDDPPYDSTDETVTVLVKNTGDEPLPATADAVDVIVDGGYVADPTVEVVDGDRWHPGTVVRITVDRRLDPGAHRVRVDVVGASDTVQFRTGRAPVGSFAYDRPVETYTETAFDARTSFDPDGAVTSYEWDVDGDGTTDATGERINHTYAEPGTYEVSLTVTDNEGNTSTTTKTVRVDARYWPGYATDQFNLGHQAVTSGPLTNVGQAWGVDLGAVDVRLSSAAVRNDSLYVGLANGTLLAVDRTDGSVDWRYDAGAAIRSSPTVYDGTVYVGSDDGTLYAVDAATGSEEWVASTNTTAGGQVVSSPAATDGTVYVGSDNDTLHAFDAADGTEQWTFTAPAGDVDSSPAVRNGTVYVGSADGSVYAVDADSGEAAWSTDLGGEIRLSGPAVTNDTLYVGVLGTDRVVALATSDGSVRWNVSVDGGVRGSPAVADGSVYVGDDTGTLTALDAADGSTQWTEAVGGSIHGSVAVADGAVYVATGTTGAGNVTAYDAETGDEYWTVALGENTTASPVVVADEVYVGRLGGSGDELVAIEGDSPDQPAAAFTYDPVSARESEPFSFDASSSTDPDGTVQSYAWDFDGDGTFGGTGETTTHAFECPGTYEVALVVGDDDGLEDLTTRSIDVYGRGAEVNWAAFRAGRARTGAPPNATGPVDAVGVEWAHETGSAVESSPAVVGDTVYVGTDNGTVLALDQCTGAVRWEFVAATDADVASSPTVVDGTLYVGVDDGTLYAVHANNGTEQWSFTEPTGAIDASPVVVDGTVYVGSADGSLYAVHAENGTKAWEYPTGDAVEFSSPTYGDDTVFVGTTDGTVHAVWADNGTARWTNGTPADAVRTTPAYDDGTVYVTGEDHALHAYDVASGNEVWNYSTGGAIRSSPAYADGTLYFGNDAGRVHGVWENGTQRWVWTNATLTGPVRGSPAVANGTVFVGDDDDGSNGGNVYALNASSGDLRWDLDLSAANVRSSPAVVEGRLYVGSADGAVYAVEEQENGD